MKKENYQLALLVTTACNLRCSYCHCNKDNVRHMSPDCARHAIDETMTSFTHEDSFVQILFMGGEPFIAFNLIRDCVQYVRTKYPFRKVSFRAVTNGTMVHGEIQEWIRRNSDRFQVVLSLDGTREQHEASRQGSYDKIDFDFFRNLKAQTQVSMVASPQTLHNLAQNIMAIESQGFYVKCALADGVTWDIERAEQTYAEELKKLIAYYCDHEEVVPCNMLSSALYCIPGEIFLPKCSPGVMAHSVASDGSHYSCYRCTPYYNNGGCVIPQDSISLKGIRYLDARCEQCVAGCICNACPASVASIRGNTEQKIARCRFSKVMFFASAYFQLELLANHPSHIFLRNKSDYQKHQIAMGARMIFDKLNPETSF